MLQHYRATLNEADTNLSDSLRYALICSIRTPVDQAVIELYKDDIHVPGTLQWAAYDTKILKIKQVYGVGGLYEVTLRIYPYYNAHNSYGIDEVVVNTNQELIRYRHVHTYPLPRR
ncbi:DUF3888 domain-containing protein [Alkalicoccobacillus gibsonii]|uniref:DUF3888 domain-containing protein n=1 Tax=Alkalicoccobacillus gibsonii TaxID=79881 RepID=UPI0019326489|nr:DUF3888 domain-containing protein [Alkalicoccobacillus gibsonii]MBM0066393.1 DUF3888 domain-containing protein [Alkalicoccobacillus gibsonii]